MKVIGGNKGRGRTEARENMDSNPTGVGPPGRLILIFIVYCSNSHKSLSKTLLRIFRAMLKNKSSHYLNLKVDVDVDDFVFILL